MPMTFTLITFAATGLDASVKVPCRHRLGRTVAAFGDGWALDGRRAR